MDRGGPAVDLVGIVDDEGVGFLVLSGNRVGQCRRFAMERGFYE